MRPGRARLGTLVLPCVAHLSRCVRYLVCGTGYTRALPLERGRVVHGCGPYPLDMSLPLWWSNASYRHSTRAAPPSHTYLLVTLETRGARPPAARWPPGTARGPGPHAIERRADAVSVSLIKCYTRRLQVHRAARGVAPRCGAWGLAAPSYTRTERVTKTRRGPSRSVGEGIARLWKCLGDRGVALGSVPGVEDGLVETGSSGACAKRPARRATCQWRRAD